MAVMRLERIRDFIIALRPLYTERGDATEVYLKNGEVEIFYAGIKSVRRNFLKNYAVDFAEQQKLLSKEMDRKKLLPFYIGDRVFIPLKMRKAVSKSDMVNGYVEVGEIRDVKAEGRTACILTLSVGHEILLTCEEETVIKGIYAGRKLKERLAGERESRISGYASLDSLLGLVAELGAVMGRRQGEGK